MPERIVTSMSRLSSEVEQEEAVIAHLLSSGTCDLALGIPHHKLAL